MRDIFRSDTAVPMPLMEERHRILNETGKILLEKFGGSFLNCVQKSGRSAQKLMQLIVENFPSYRDEAEFEVSLLLREGFSRYDHSELMLFLPKPGLRPAT